MNSKEEIENQAWEKMKPLLYKTEGYIDFSKINDDDSRAKLALFLMEVAEWGSEKIISEGSTIIRMLENQIKSLGNSKEKREEIEEINSDIQQIHKAISSCEEAVEKIETERNEIRKKFWIEKWEEIIPEWEKKKREFDFSEQNMQKLRSRDKFSMNEVREKLLARRFDDPEDYSPFNDPDNKFGWKEFCITKQKLYAHSLEEFVKQNKTMEVTDDKQDTPPSSGDKGTKYSGNSLRPRNNSTESEGSSGCKDSGISSDETSTSPERKSVKIDYSKVKKTLDRIILRPIKPLLASKLPPGYFDSFKFQSLIIGNWSEDHEVLVKRALLDFCERHLLNPPDDYLLLGLGYVRFKQSNVVLTN